VARSKFAHLCRSGPPGVAAEYHAASVDFECRSNTRDSSITWLWNLHNPLNRLIAERTGGNPFFIKEIVQALFDEGALVRNGAVKVTRSLSQLRLPPTVQGILASRIDRQPSEHKQLLQTLSVIGRESSLGLLSQVASHPDTQLERMLADLRAGDFIYEQPTATGIEYVFKHALTQEVAYNSLLIERRKQIHEQAGQALEAMFTDQLDDHLTQLAHHYSHSENANGSCESFDGKLRDECLNGRGSG
jgi:predicted ATPase